MGRRRRKNNNNKNTGVEGVKNLTNITKAYGYNITDTTQVKKHVPLCHLGFKEIFNNVYVGKVYDITITLLNKIDILVPLDYVGGTIWDLEWNGEIYYVPIKDYSVLPKNIEEQKVDYILNKIKEGKRVAIFCIGGHGRTGYFASLILGKLGVEDPIKLLREKYCKDTIETQEQVDAVADFLNLPNLKTLYEVYPISDYFDDCNYASWWKENDSISVEIIEDKPSQAEEKSITTKFSKDYRENEGCGKCNFLNLKYGSSSFGYCEFNGKIVNKFDKVCKEGFDPKELALGAGEE
jgi:hypothetical protein